VFRDNPDCSVPVVIKFREILSQSSRESFSPTNKSVRAKSSPSISLKEKKYIKGENPRRRQPANYMYTAAAMASEQVPESIKMLAIYK
jgi:hypothetical protein